MSRNGVIGVISAVAVVCGLGIAGFYRYQQAHYVFSDNATVSGHQVVVSAQGLGRIVAMTASEGQRVAKGEVLVRLDDTALQEAEQEAQAGVESARTGVSLSRDRLNQADQDLARATIQYRNGIIPAARYEQIKTAEAEAKAGYGIALAGAGLAAARLDTVRTSLAKTIIASPVDGVVAKKWKAVGDVTAPTQPIYTLYDLSDLWVAANIKETHIRFVKVGDPVRITVDSLPGRHFLGRVETLGVGTVTALSSLGSGGGSPNFTKETQWLPVKIAIDSRPQAHAALLPGMSAVVKVEIRSGGGHRSSTSGR